MQISAVETSDVTARPMQSGDAAAASRKWVALLYEGFFGRHPSTAESQFHISTGLPPHEIAWNLFYSSEFDIVGRFPAALYLATFDRDADYSGWLCQREALRTGATTQTQMATAFLRSDEARHLRNQPNSVFIQMLYRRVFGRHADPVRLDDHVRELLAGKPREVVLMEVLNSPEACTPDVTPRISVHLLYFALLRREPAPHEYVARVEALAKGVSLHRFIELFISTMDCHAGLIEE